MPPAHQEFFATLLPFWETERFIFVHAGIMPGIPLADQDLPTLCEKRGEFLTSEIEVGNGVIGVAARERTPVRIMHMTSAYLYSHAIRSSLRDHAPGLLLDTDIPYPGLAEPHSQLAVPIESAGRLLGVLFAESPEDLRFGFEDEDALVTLAGHLGAAIDLMQARPDTLDTPFPLSATPPAPPATGTALRLRRFRANDSVFVNDSYLIKGVAGAIFWKLASDHARHGRTEFSNRELEAFSYSVSHDLKAPIRAIQGFSRMLGGEHASQLDKEGLRLLDVIVNNTQIMTNIIDDLLALSRLGRQQIRKSSIDLAAMAGQVFDQLQEQEQDKDLQLTIQDLPKAWGDYSLINQVILNLLGNAIKFIKAKETASIEVGGYIQGQETIYYVKDTGIGFDERYADKLFGVFQRLHHGPEYEGTGVGLSIVQRIIQRHGGRVWAEGTVGEGAIFYFALPKNEA